MNDSFKRIGQQLQAARKERGLRTADVARELRISADYLRWLETGDFDQLPAPTYVSGFLRSYGKFLELDGADLAGRFYAIVGDASSNVDFKLPITAGPPHGLHRRGVAICRARAGWLRRMVLDQRSKNTRRHCGK